MPMLCKKCGTSNPMFKPTDTNIKGRWCSIACAAEDEVTVHSARQTKHCIAEGCERAIVSSSPFCIETEKREFCSYACATTTQPSHQWESTDNRKVRKSHIKARNEGHCPQGQCPIFNSFKKDRTVKGIMPLCDKCKKQPEDTQKTKDTTDEPTIISKRGTTDQAGGEQEQAITVLQEPYCKRCKVMSDPVTDITEAVYSTKKEFLSKHGYVLFEHGIFFTPDVEGVSAKSGAKKENIFTAKERPEGMRSTRGRYEGGSNDDGVWFDLMRWQVPIAQKTKKLFWGRAEPHVTKILGKTLIPSNGYKIFNDEGARDQQMHTDFAPEAFGVGKDPFVLFMAYEGDTKVLLTDKADGLDKTIDIPRGHGMLFHGLMPHSGISCEHPRVHFYLTCDQEPGIGLHTNFDISIAKWRETQIF